MGRKKKTVSDENVNTLDEFVSLIRDVAKGSYNVEVGTLDELEENLMPTGYVSTGDDYLDFIISNRKNGGLPLGKYINIYSEEGVGKSLLVAKVMANVQKMGGKAIYFDTERAAYPPFMEILGVDMKKTVYISKVNTVEKILETIVTIIHNYLKNNSTYPMVIAIDSMTMVTTEKGASLDDFSQEDQGYGEGALKQKLLNIGLKKIHNLIRQDKIMFITTDQVRDNFKKVGKFDKNTTDTAGWAQKYYSDVRIELRRAAKLKLSDGTQVGNKVRAEVVKNRVAPAYRNSILYLYNTRGMDNISSWIENGKAYGVLKASGAYISVKDAEGNKVLTDEGKSPDKKFIKKKLVEDKKFREFIYDQMAEKMIMHYESFSEAQFVDMEDVEEVEESSSPAEDFSKLINRDTDSGDDNEE